MANAIDGLGTVNVSQFVNQLMALETRQQDLLKARRNDLGRVQTAWQGLNTAFNLIRSNAEKIAGVTGTTPQPWSVSSVTSSSTSVAGSATASAVTGSYNVDVTALAATHRVLYGGSVALDATAAGPSIDITRGGTTTTLALTDTTLSGVAAAINGRADLGVRAALINTGAGGYRLQLSSATSGAAGAFTVTGLDAALGAPTVTTTGSDAEIRFGPAPTDVVRSATNTFSDVFPGVTFTVSKLETGVTLDVADDTTAMAAQVKAVIDSMNAARGQLSAATAFNASTRTGGPLLGERLPQQLSGSLASTVSASTAGSLWQVGIELTRTGDITFDESKFATALRSGTIDARGLIRSFTTAVRDVAESAVQRDSGSITTTMSGAAANIRRVEDSISAWDDRLESRRRSLTRQFSALNVTLERLKSQAVDFSSRLNQAAS